MKTKQYIITVTANEYDHKSLEHYLKSYNDGLPLIIHSVYRSATVESAEVIDERKLKPKRRDN